MEFLGHVGVLAAVLFFVLAVFGVIKLIGIVVAATQRYDEMDSEDFERRDN